MFKMEKLNLKKFEKFQLPKSNNIIGGETGTTVENKPTTYTEKEGCCTTTITKSGDFKTIAI